MQEEPGSFPFGKELKSYNYGEVTTPYQRLQQDFDMPIGQYLHQAKQWRIGFMISTLLAVVLIFIFIMQMGMTPFHIYAIGITDKGYPKSEGFLEENARPPVALYTQFMQQTFHRYMNDDSRVNKRLENFFSENARHNFTHFFNNQLASNEQMHLSHFQLDRKHNRLTFLAEASDRSGNRTYYQFVAVIQSQTPQQKKLIEKNPLGFYVKDLHYRLKLMHDSSMEQIGNIDGK